MIMVAKDVGEKRVRKKATPTPNLAVRSSVIGAPGKNMLGKKVGRAYAAEWRNDASTRIEVNQRAIGPIHRKVLEGVVWMRAGGKLWQKKEGR